MMAVLRQKLIRLVRDEEGVALVVTLALFMFLYISCAAVFAIGSAVKDKIALQNAVDAAAYSAAIVEADTLSKIATINRAMAYTYYSMVMNQMNYIVWKWLYASTQMDSPDSPIELDGEKANYAINQLNAKSISDITLQNGRTISIKDVDSALLDKGLTWAKKLRSAIDDERDALDNMHNEVNKLIAELPKTQEVVIANILKANLPDTLGDWCFYKPEIPNYSAVFTADGEVHEDEFLLFLNVEDPTISKDRFEEIGLWFPLGDGIMRSWVGANGELLSRWTWQDYYDRWHAPDVDANDDLKDSYFEGREAKPRKLKKNYFSDAKGVARGAITVAVAMLQQNPWEKLIKRHEGRAGFYDAFSPHKEKNWVYAVASAQAAYRPFRAGAGKDYSLDWKSFGNENLRTDDWDAVFVPVSRAFSDDDGDDFKTFITSESGWNKVSDSPDSALPNYEVTDNVPLPRMHNNGGSLKNVNWNELLKKIYH